MYPPRVVSTLYDTKRVLNVGRKERVVSAMKLTIKLDSC